MMLFATCDSINKSYTFLKQNTDEMTKEYMLQSESELLTVFEV